MSDILTSLFSSSKATAEKMIDRLPSVEPLKTVVVVFSTQTQTIFDKAFDRTIRVKTISLEGNLSTDDTTIISIDEQPQTRSGAWSIQPNQDISHLVVTAAFQGIRVGRLTITYEGVTFSYPTMIGDAARSIDTTTRLERQLSALGSPNLISNGSFETGDLGLWYFITPYWTVITSDMAYGGGIYSVKITHTATNIKQLIPFVYGDECIFGCFVYGAAGNKVRFYLNYLDGTYEMVEVTLAAAHWNDVILEPTKHLIGYEIAVQYESGTGDIYIDDVFGVKLTSQVSLGNSRGKTVIGKTGNLVTTGSGADQVILTYTVTAGKTLYLQYIDVTARLTTYATTATLFGTASLENPAATKLVTAMIANAGVINPPYHKEFSEPIPIAAGTVIRIVCTPAAVTSFTWQANFGGYEK